MASLQEHCGKHGFVGSSLWGTVFGVDCNILLSFFWSSWALQAFFLLTAMAAVAAAAVHTFRSSLWAQGAICTALGVWQCHRAYAEIKNTAEVCRACMGVPSKPTWVVAWR